MPHDPIATRIASATFAPVRGIPVAYLLAAILTVMGLDSLLLLRFIGVGAFPTGIAAATALALIVFAIARQVREEAGVPLRRLFVCLAIGLVVMALGGEGRIFYANYDWVIRDSVLADMVRWPWPYAYVGHGMPEILRAPVGMYLLPALAGKWGGQSTADLALLFQNGVILGLLLAIGSTLFETARARRTALIVLLAFSGMDAIGALLSDPASLFLSPTTHIENWNGGILQYSSDITLAFWVPQHALCGWLGALLFLLWREGRLPLSHFLAIVPLMILWSPLGVMGTLPFAAYAGIDTLLRRRLAPRDIALPALCLVTAAVPILYLQANSGSVGIHTYLPSPRIYALFILLEAAPLLWVVWSGSRGGRIGRRGFALVAGCLLAFPFVMVGVGADFVMRASIPSLAILAVLVADLFTLELSRKFIGGLLVILIVGSVTPARELLRAISFRPTPTPRCDLWTTWDHSFPTFTKTTYFAPVASLPEFLQAKTIHPESRVVSSRCWDRRWDESRFGA